MTPTGSAAARWRPAGADAALSRLGERWQRLAERERRLVLVAAGLVVAALLWAIAVAPAWRTLRTAPAQVDELDERLDAMRALAAESRSLRDAAPVTVAQASAALKSATEPLGATAVLAIQGDRATLTLAGVEPQALANWLREARSAARARPIEAQWTRSGGGYAGKLVLSLDPAQ